jgi:hypothetical protein
VNLTKLSPPLILLIGVDGIRDLPGEGGLAPSPSQTEEVVMRVRVFKRADGLFDVHCAPAPGSGLPSVLTKGVKLEEIGETVRIPAEREDAVRAELKAMRRAERGL